jgi:hypothetical protein
MNDRHIAYKKGDLLDDLTLSDSGTALIALSALLCPFDSSVCEKTALVEDTPSAISYILGPPEVLTLL